MGIKMTDSLVSEAREKHENGMSYRKVAAMLGVTHETIRYHLDPAVKKWRIAYARDYREKWRQASIQYYIDHAEKLRQYSREYNRNHLSERAARGAKRRAIKNDAFAIATDEQIAEIKEIYRRAKEDKKVRCYLCGKLIPLGHRQVDHIIPLSKKGKHCPSNLAVACDICNNTKGAKMPGRVGILI